MRKEAHSSCIRYYFASGGRLKYGKDEQGCDFYINDKKFELKVNIGRGGGHIIGNIEPKAEIKRIHSKNKRSFKAFYKFLRKYETKNLDDVYSNLKSKDLGVDCTKKVRVGIILDEAIVQLLESLNEETISLNEDIIIKKIKNLYVKVWSSIYPTGEKYYNDFLNVIEKYIKNRTLEEIVKERRVISKNEYFEFSQMMSSVLAKVYKDMQKFDYIQMLRTTKEDFFNYKVKTVVLSAQQIDDIVNQLDYSKLKEMGICFTTLPQIHGANPAQQIAPTIDIADEYYNF